MDQPWRIGVIVETWANRVTAGIGSTLWRRVPVDQVDQKRASLRGWLALQDIGWTAETRRAMVCGIMYALNDAGTVPIGKVADLVNIAGCLLLDLDVSREDFPQEIGEETPPPAGDGL